MRSNLFIQRQKLKQSTVWETFFVGLFVRHSSKKSAIPIHSPLTIACVNVIEWCLICWLFTLFAKVSFAFFSFESVRIFCPTFYNLRWCVLNTFALHKSKHRFCPLLINECKKKEFLPKTESRCANRYCCCKNDVT